MYSLSKNLRLPMSSHRLLSRSSILCGSTWIMSTHSNNKRHRTSSSPAHHSHGHHHSPHRIHSNKTNNPPSSLRRLCQPIEIKPMMSTDQLNSTTSIDSETNIGQELTGGKTLDRSKRQFAYLLISTRKVLLMCLFFCSDALLRVITDFYRREEIKKLAADQGRDTRLFQDAYVSFRKVCIQSTVLPIDLHIDLSDIIS